MVSLSNQDALELLGYTATQRHPLEILGFEYSTRRAKEFRQERPNLAPRLRQLIEDSLEETGLFPREPSEDVLQEGIYLERRSDGVTALHMTVEVGISQTRRVRCDFSSIQDAISELLRRVADPAYCEVTGR